MGRSQNVLPGLIAVALLLGACSNTPPTTTVEAAPVTTSSTAAQTTTTEVVPTTTLPPTTTSTIDPDNPFLQHPGGEVVGAPMPEFDQTAETYGDLERWLAELDAVLVWINSNPEATSDELLLSTFSQGTAEGLMRVRDERVANGTRLLSSDLSALGTVNSLTAAGPDFTLDTALPEVPIVGFQVVTVRPGEQLLVDADGEIIETREGWASGNLYQIQIERSEVGWRFLAVEFIGTS